MRQLIGSLPTCSMWASLTAILTFSQISYGQIHADQEIVSGNLVGDGYRQVFATPSGELISGYAVESPNFVAYNQNQLEVESYTETAFTDFYESHDQTDDFKESAGIFVAPSTGVYTFSLTASIRHYLSDFDNIPVILRLKSGSSTPAQIVQRVIIRSNYGEDIFFRPTVYLLAGTPIHVSLTTVTGQTGEAGKVRCRLNFTGYKIN